MLVPRADSRREVEALRAKIIALEKAKSDCDYLIGLADGRAEIAERDLRAARVYIRDILSVSKSFYENSGEVNFSCGEEVYRAPLACGI